MNQISDAYILDETTTIGNAVLNVMKDCKLTRVDLSRRTGLSINTIHNLINGRNSTIATLLKVSKALEIKASRLLDN